MTDGDMHLGAQSSDSILKLGVLVPMDDGKMSKMKTCL